MNKYSLWMAALGMGLGLLIAPQHAQARTLFLVGGGMQSCASQNLKACERGALDPLALRQSRTQLKVALTPAALDRATGTEHWPSAEAARQARRHLATVAEAQGSDPISKADFTDALRDSEAGEQWYQGLSDAQWYTLVDRLEAIQTDRYGQRLEERVFLEANRDPHTPELVNRFAALAAQAGGKTQPGKHPVLVVMTSSARDPFEARDFYQGLFASTGAEVHWLPLDASVQSARRAHECRNLERHRQQVQGNADRARVYPQLAAAQQQLCIQPQSGLDLLARADGLFINGGDQWLTWQALRAPDGTPSDELTLIARRVAEGRLVVGGTSAGTAVQAGPVMITNGSNASALLTGPTAAPPPARDCDGSAACRGLQGDSLTYEPLGGLGLFESGITDTHFTERGRQLRLARLAAHSGQALAVGVDENTALIVQSERWQVLGQAGVWVWQTPGTTHYLQPGDEAQWRDGTLSVALANPIKEGHHDENAPLVRALSLENADYRRLADALCQSTQQQTLGQITLGERRFGALLTVNEESEFGRGPSGHCSYKNLSLKVGAVGE
ncbi:cyanophycinase [Ferrimonas balearica]|uniref:cyanophycinase n=1 Tax=Ferrimonas balearica TaxID=44012 RepID=UPI001C9927B5|nr:cyanophycinase [Ferrimonas balearica]MBY5991214.1 cyanophycinase [Ferrimonas balearica]